MPNLKRVHRLNDDDTRKGSTLNIFWRNIGSDYAVQYLDQPTSGVNIRIPYMMRELMIYLAIFSVSRTTMLHQVSWEGTLLLNYSVVDVTANTWKLIAKGLLWIYIMKLGEEEHSLLSWMTVVNICYPTHQTRWTHESFSQALVTIMIELRRKEIALFPLS
jgi:hypothetical protein